MLRSRIATLVLLLATPTLSLASDGEEKRATKQSQIASFVQSFCFECHGDGNSEGEIDLAEINAEVLRGDADLARELIQVLDNREMPPEDKPQPTAEQREQILATLYPILQQAVTTSRSQETASIRRMNRFQYNNAVIDLFDLKCIVFTLPERAMRIHKDYFNPQTGKMPDTVTVGNRPLGKSQMIEPRLAGVAAFPQDLRAENGYDTQGDHLSLSPLLMDEFLKLGQSITQSPDFNPKRVGIWKSFFQPPAKDVSIESSVRNRIQNFLTRAFRRPANPDEVERYSQFVIDSLEREVGFTEAMKSVAAATIASPRFLYLYDHRKSNPSDGIAATDDSNRLGTSDRDYQTIDDIELASRLSFFLWGSLPDETLLSLAAAGKLSQPDVLNEQIDRLLKDKKLKRFCDSFPSQWLQLDRIISAVPNREKFADFYFSKYRVSMHMMMEPLLLFETVLIEDLPITQLIDSDFTYRSGKLDSAYGSLKNGSTKQAGSGVTVLNFQRVPVTDRRVGGVITNAAVMTMTSGPERTQPITRGAWVAGVIFNDPPDPAPADVPPLAEKPSSGEEKLTLRQRLAAHRERSDCRGCHEQIDPLGFALENFDPVGRWREVYENGANIDMAGKLFRQYPFTNIVEFKDAVLANQDRFCRALAGHLLSFALARELRSADYLVIDQIADAVAADDYKMQTLIRQIILCESFRRRS
ncbi:MAG: DUF1592 domain-containing protein [Planctomycetota bacterium]|nr:DUF1592 domain-containing protein [Planctomycetota bacterium]